MKKRSDAQSSREESFNRIIGLGSKSIRKSYYPELKEKIASLDRQNAFYQSILNSIPDSVLIARPSGEIIQVNPAALDTFGYSAPELIGNRLETLFADGDAVNPEYREYLTDSTRGYRRKDGSVFVGEAHKSRILDSDGVHIGNIEVIRDTSARIEALTQQKMLEQQLQKSQKMEAIGSLSGGIAHDFNNILAGIIGYAELVELFEIADIGEIRNSISEILKASYRARELVKQILMFSRGGSQELAEVALIKVAHEALQIVKATTFAPDIVFEERYETRTDTVLGDPTQLHQVITNLCTNAVYAMKEAGGTLTVSLSEMKTSSLSPPPLDDQLPDTMLLLSISDTGCGIPSEVINHIFEPYFTTKKVGEGTGFGLALVHGIVKSHGGYVEVKSREGKGSCFNIFLPQKLEKKKTEISASPVALLQGGGRILLVDDEVQQLEWGRKVLERLGYSVVTYRSGKEALKLFQDCEERFSVVVVDQTMPGLTGLEFSTQIRTIYPELPVILCTGYSHSLSLEAIQAAGVAKVINKPYGPAELASTLRQMLE